MKKLTMIFSMAAICGLSSVGHAQVAFESEDLQLDFTEPMQSIKKVAQSATPMAKHLEKGITALNSTIAEVKKDPNKLNKSKFELQFAKHIKTLVNDIDSIIQHQQEIEWAFDDITDEVKRVGKRLDYNNERMKEKVFRQNEKVKTTLKQLKEMARKIEAQGGKKAPAASQREFKRQLRKYKLMQRTLKTQKKVQSQLHKTLAGMGKNGSSIANGAKDLKVWFDSLKDQRDAFLSLAEARKDMAQLSQLMSQGGTKSLIATFDKLKGIQTQLDKFNDTFEKMDDNLDVLQTFNPDDLSLDTEESDGGEEVWKAFLD